MYFMSGQEALINIETNSYEQITSTDDEITLSGVKYDYWFRFNGADYGA
jgi:hypothetical protein